MPNQSEVCFRVLSCVLREIDQIVRKNLAINYSEYFRRYHKITYFKVCEVRIKHKGCRC